MNNVNTMAVSADTAPASVIEVLTSANEQFFCSIADDGTRAAKVRIYNAINGADNPVKEHIGEVLEIVDVCAYPISVVDEQTGEVKEVLRTVLIDKEGTSYSAVSVGVVNSLSRIFALIGTPENGAWHTEPVRMKFKTKGTRNGANAVTIIELV